MFPSHDRIVSVPSGTKLTNQIPAQKVASDSEKDPMMGLEAKATQFLSTQNKDPRNMTAITLE